MSAILQVIQSGSSANGYILTCGGNKLILEAGCKKEEYLKALNYVLNNVRGILCTHAHLDHSRSLDMLMDYGLQAYAPFEVSAVYPRCKVVNKFQRYNIGGFIIMPLKVPHGNCEECYAYHITMPDGQTLLFCTDAERFPYSIKGITHICIEANYSNEIIVDSLVNGDILRSQSQNHMELEECIATVKRLRHRGLQSVILVHLSNGLSDEQMFKEKFKSKLGINAEIAEPNKTFSLEISEF